MRSAGISNTPYGNTFSAAFEVPDTSAAWRKRTPSPNPLEPMANAGTIPTITPEISTKIVAITFQTRMLKKSAPPASPR